METRYTMDAINRWCFIMLLSCFMGPHRKQVEAKAVMLPSVYNIANFWGLVTIDPMVIIDINDSNHPIQKQIPNPYIL